MAELSWMRTLFSVVFKETVFNLSGSMQLDMLITNINLVLRSNVLTFKKLTIPGQTSIFLVTPSAASIQ